MLNIYIAPPQENNSTAALLKGAVLRCEKNAGDKALGKTQS